MKNKLSFDCCNSILKVRINDVIEANDIKDFYSEIYSKAKDNETTSILLDFTVSELQMSFTQIYTMPSAATEAGFNWFYKTAAVINDMCPKYSFFETVFRNQGFNTKTFTSTEQACIWLKENRSLTPENSIVS